MGVLNLSDVDGVWRKVGHMPLALSGLKGATLGNVFHVVGGYFDHQYYDEVLAWDPVADSWLEVGGVSSKGAWQAIGVAVTSLPVALLEEFCSEENINEVK